MVFTEISKWFSKLSLMPLEVLTRRPAISPEDFPEPSTTLDLTRVKNCCWQAGRFAQGPTLGTWGDAGGDRAEALRAPRSSQRREDESLNLLRPGLGRGGPQQGVPLSRCPQPPAQPVSTLSTAVQRAFQQSLAKADRSLMISVYLKIMLPASPHRRLVRRGVARWPAGLPARDAGATRV